MGQVTIYLDDESEKRLKAAAAAAGVPVSRWVSALIQNRTRTQWPESARQLVGGWKDFPELTELRGDTAEDVARERF